MKPSIRNLAVLASALAFPLVTSQDLNNAQIANVRNRLEDSAKLSWEIGTRAEALLELDTPNASVFNNTNSIPAPASAGITSAYLTPVISIAKSTVQARKAGGALVSDDTSVADPASIGVAVLLANLTVGSDTTTNYAQAASDQLNYLLHTAPRAPDGAISHRTDSVQLWSDFIYMVPPFLAYYGAVTANQSLLEEAYNQIKLYRGHLKDDSGLWKHIATGDGSPNGADPSHWSTGNGWAAAGMLRVAATMAQSQFSKDLRGQQDDLASWVHEIQAGMYAHFDASTGLFTNVADNSASFRDAASSALLAHSVYRLAHVKGWYDFIPQAEITRSAIARSNINAQGWLQPVVDPHSVSKEGEESPEGQAFVLLMQAAWKDWRVDGAKGVKNAAAERSVGVSGTIMMMVWGAFFVCIL